MRHIYAGFLALLPCIVFAKSNSLTIQPRYTTSYRFTATEVWNIDLQFSGLKPAQVYLQVKITGQSGKAIADVTSVNFMLNPGLQSYTYVTLGTSQLQYLSREVADIESLTGSFPAGNYKVCYWARCVSPDCNGNGADAIYNETPECFELVVEPPTPLLLAFPEDKSEIEMTRPTFNWVPPMPIASVQGFNYLYTLVEKRKNQSCPDAILTNRPLYKQSGVEMPVLPYPPEINDLDTGKTYCWKVDGLVSDIPVAQSEVWEFKVKGKERKVTAKQSFLPERKLGLEAYKISLGDTVILIFNEEYLHLSENRLSLSAYDETAHKPRDKSLKVDYKILPGTNNIMFIPTDHSGILVGHTYVFTVSNGKREKYYIRLNILDTKK